MLTFFKKATDVSNPKSISNRFRTKRFRNFLDFIKGLPKPVKILDAGGTQLFWEQMKFTSPDDVSVIILNNEPINTTLPNFTFIHGTALEIDKIPEKDFDVIFSNSVIEHVGNSENQKKMANGIISTGKQFFIQTPNYYFPIEPHFLFPFFQFLPQKLKIYLLIHFKIGWFEKQNSHESALEIMNSIKLLRFRDVKSLFPDSQIIKEKFLSLTKSFIITSKSK